MLLATRQPSGEAALPAALQPSTYFGQCVFTHSGIRKLAEIGPQPRLAISVTPCEKGATAVPTMGGCGRWKGFMMKPWPISGIMVLPTETFQNWPCRSYGGSLSQIFSTMLMHSTNMALRSRPKLPNTSASDIRPPGLMPMMKRPCSRWSSMAACAATAAGWLLGMLIVPVPSLICRVWLASEARNIIEEVTVSAASVTCSPTKASENPRRSASSTASWSSRRVWEMSRPGGCSGIMKVL